MIRIGVIGYGYWGPNLVRNFFAKDDCQIITIADNRHERLTIVQKLYPSINVTTNPNDILNDSSIDAVVIATAISTHYSLAKAALNNGKHVLVEKPISSTYKEGMELVKLSKKTKKVLMVDHTFLYTDAVQKIKRLINTGEIGRIDYFDSTRTNLGLFQKDANVIWDLATHDISILTYLIQEKPISIQASGISHTKNNIENIGFITIKYASGLIAHFSCSWCTPVKIRLILIGGTKKMIVYNDIEPTEKIKVYDTGYQVINYKDKDKMLIDYRIGDIYLPKVELKEALCSMTDDFIIAIKNNRQPIADAQSSLLVLKILSYCDQSLRNGEKPINVKGRI